MRLINRLWFTSTRNYLTVVAVLAASAFTGRVSAQVVSLGAASDFSVLGSTTVTNTGPTVITGDVGVAPGTAITGLLPAMVGGTIHSNDATAIQAQADATLAYNFLSALNAIDLTGQDLGGMVLTPGVYSFDSSAALTGTLILDGLGQINPLFVFQTGSTFISAAGSAMSLINGADAGNVFFTVGSSATLGIASVFTGTLLAAESITATTGAIIDEGRLIALNGAITLDSNTIAVVPEPSSAALFLTSAAIFLYRRKRNYVTR